VTILVFNSNSIACKKTFLFNRIAQYLYIFLFLDSGLSTINGCETDAENLHLSLSKTRYNEGYGGLDSSNFHDINFDEDGYEDESYSDNGHKIRRFTSPGSSMSMSPTTLTHRLNKQANSETISETKPPNGPPDRMFKIVFAGDAVRIISSFFSNML
jgi:hypothetical protein